MNRASLAAYVAEIEATEPDPARRATLILLAADEYAAHLIETWSRSPRYAQPQREAAS